MTTPYEVINGVRHYYVSKEAMLAASFLDSEDAPELTEEQFERLTERMRETDERDDDLGAKLEETTSE